MTVEQIALGLAGSSIELPCFFASVSSVKSSYGLLDYVGILVASGYPCFLVSAYDVSRLGAEELDRLNDQLAAARRNGQVVLIDSGTYESFWLRDSAWTRETYLTTMRTLDADIAFAYDSIEQAGSDSDIQRIIAAWQEDQDILADMSVFPVVHGTPTSIASRAAIVAEATGSLMIAVPERTLGEGSDRRLENIRAIRASLDDVSEEVVLHVLGTGDPLSVAAYALAGAGSFDGLEWCEHALDLQTGRAYHFQQRHLCQGLISEDALADVSYAEGTLFHNLAAMSSWMGLVRSGGLLAQLDGAPGRWLERAHGFVVDR